MAGQSPLRAAWLRATVVAALLVSACAAGQPAVTPPPGAISVTFTEYVLGVAPAGATAGPVSFFLANAGQTKHDFVLLGPTGLDAAALPSDDGWETIDEWEVGVLGARRGIQPGQAATFDVQLGVGHYVLICNLPDHYSAGMRANFDVR